jgi:hypothetical protein
LEASQILGKCFEARASFSAVISSRLWKFRSKPKIVSTA